MDEFESIKSGRFHVDPLPVSVAPAPMLSDISILGSRNSFQNPHIPSSQGFSIEDLPCHHSGPYDQPPLPLHPGMSKIDQSHAGQQYRAVAQSFPRSSTLPYHSYSHLVSHNIVTTNGFRKTCSQSDASKYSFEHTLNKQSSLLENTSNDMHMMMDPRQRYQELEIRNNSLMNDTNHFNQRSVEPYRPTYSQQHRENALVLKQLNSGKDHEHMTPLQSLVKDTSHSGISENGVRKCSTSSVGVNQAAGTGINDMLSNLSHGKAYYKCGFCDLKLSSNEALLGHINTHTDYMPYSCSLCGISFVEVRQLMKHVHHSHNVKAPYACGLCNLTFHENLDLKQHIVSHEADKSSTDANSKIAPFKEKAIPGNLPTSLDVRKDVPLDNDEETEEDNGSNDFNPSEVHCLSSNTIVISKDTRFNLRKEPSKIVMDDVDLESVCTVIVEPSTAGGIRKKHLFKCNFCQKVCKDKGSLVSHVRTHTKGRPYECCVCFAKFKQYAHLSDHITTKHSKDRPYVCDRCAKAFNRKSHLQDHIRLKHTEDKLYHCTECPQTFQKNSEFSEHKRTHGKTLKYQCNSCPRQFRNITDYERHIRSHTKEKLFECEICHLTFGLLANAKKHMVKHDKERPFKCDICPKAYHFEHDFKRHKITHLMKKPFPCSDCYKSFKNSALLKKHAKTAHMKIQVHSEKPFQCLTCKRHFKSRLKLDQHSKLHAQKKASSCPPYTESCISEAGPVQHSESHVNKSPLISNGCDKDKGSALNFIADKEKYMYKNCKSEKEIQKRSCRSSKRQLEACENSNSAKRGKPSME